MVTNFDAFNPTAGSNLKTDAPHRDAIGALVSLAVGTRPHISFAIAELARYCEEPLEYSWAIVKRVMRYIAVTMALGLVYRGDAYLALSSYSYSDWAGVILAHLLIKGCMFLSSRVQF